MIRILGTNAPTGRLQEEPKSFLVLEIQDLLDKMLIDLATKESVDSEVRLLLDALSYEPTLGSPELESCKLFLEIYNAYFQTVDEDMVMILDTGFIALLDEYLKLAIQAQRIYRFAIYRPVTVSYDIDILSQLKFFLDTRKIPDQSELVQYLKNLQGVDLIMSMIIVDYLALTINTYKWTDSFCKLPKDYPFKYISQVINMSFEKRKQDDDARKELREEYLRHFENQPNAPLQDEIRLEDYYAKIEGILDQAHLTNSPLGFEIKEVQEEDIYDYDIVYQKCMKTIEKIFMSGITNINFMNGPNSLIYCSALLFQIVRSYEEVLENFNSPVEVFIKQDDENVKSFLKKLVPQPNDRNTSEEKLVLESMHKTLGNFFEDLQKIPLDFIMDLFAEFYTIMNYFIQMMNILIRIDTGEYTTDKSAQQTLKVIRTVASVVEHSDNSSEIVRHLYEKYDVIEDHNLLILYLYYFSRPEQITKIQKKIFEVVSNRWIWKYRNRHKQYPHGVFGSNHEMYENNQLASFIHSYAKRKTHDLRILIHPKFDLFYKKCFLAGYLEDYENKYSYDEMLQLARWYVDNPENLKYLQADFSETQIEMMRILRSVQSIERRSICTRVVAYDTMYQGATIIRDTISELTYYPCAALMEHVHRCVNRTGLVTYIQVENVIKHNRDPKLKSLREGLEKFFYNYTQTRDIVEFQRALFEEYLYGIFAEAMTFVTQT